MHAADTQPAAVSRARFVIGAALFIGGFLSPLAIPLVTRSDLPAQWKTILGSGLIAGLPELGMLAAVAVLGKEGFAQLKERLFLLLRRHTEPSAVGPLRYRLGLLMFCIPLLSGFLQPYLALVIPALSQPSLSVVVAIDLVFATSFLVLGAGFWDKIRGLFTIHPNES